MDFLNKLDGLMEEKKLNKSRLSKACGIPYTTIDGWYKKGYEGLKLTTLRKLSDFFGVSLDYWVDDYPSFPSISSNTTFPDEQYTHALTVFQKLNPEFQNYVIEQMDRLLDLQNSHNGGNHNSGNT